MLNITVKEKFMSKLFRYKYPKRKSYIKLFKDKSTNQFMFYDYVEEDAFKLSRDEYVIARGLDGKTDPFTIDPKMPACRVREVLFNLKHIYKMTTKNRIERTDLFSWNLTLIDFKKTNKFSGLICRILTYFQLLLTIPITVLGVYLLLSADNFSYSLAYNFNFIEYFIGLIIFMLIGVIFHEAGHAISGVAFGAKLFEAGITFGVIGAYVMMSSDKKSVKSRMQRLQINAAGIQNNLLLSGVLMILAHNACGNLYYLLFGGSIMNLTLAFANMLFVRGVDGYYIVTEILEVEDDPVSTIKNAIKSRSFTNLSIKTGNIILLAAFLLVFICLLAIMVLLITKMFVPLN